MSTGRKMTFWDLIKSPDVERIEIPQIQRDYVQGRHTPQVEYARERLLGEIREALETGKPLDLNFVYGKDDNRVFVPIDGQQRLTTLLTLHIYAFAKEKKTDELNVLKNKFTYLTRISTQRFLKALAENIPAYFDQNHDDIKDFIQDSAWYSVMWNNDPSVNSFLVVLDDIDKRFKEVSDLAAKLTTPKCPVSFMELRITDMGLINDLYIKMNSRGKALTEFEAFKSELFDYLDTLDTNISLPAFKQKSDDKWLSMIWDICKDRCEKPEKECDSVYMSFLHGILMNRLTADRYNDRYKDASKHWENLNADNGFYNFADYKPFLSDGKALKDVYATFELCCWLIENHLGEETSHRIYRLYESGKRNYVDQVQVVALTKYAVDVPETSWSADSWNAWNRVITNLIHNAEIDKAERFSSATSSIYSMDTQAPANTYHYFAGISANRIDFFSKIQVEEEILKCNLIILDKDWLPALMRAESHSYFDGEIRFALTLSGISCADPALDQKRKQADFTETWQIIKLIFDPNGPANLGVDESLFRRGLLTYGDYSIWANSTYTLFFESGKGYFNWRRMLRDSLSVFARLFNDLKAQNVSTSAEVNDFLNNAINTYDDKTDELLYYMVKVPAVLEFMRENRFRRPAEDPINRRNILYSGARLSADYAELYSYVAFCQLPGSDHEYHYGRGYLNSQTTLAYIEKIKGQKTHIAYDYSQKCFCDENQNPMVDASSNPITTVEDLLANI